MTVSKSLKKLVQMGFVNRIEHEVDTRAKSVSLTEKGKDMIRTLVPIVEGIDSTFFGKAYHKEQKSLIQILAKLTAGTIDEIDVKLLVPLLPFIKNKNSLSSAIQNLKKTLHASIDSTPEKVSIYFKTSPGSYAEHDSFMGVTVPTLRKIAKSFLYVTLEDLGLLIQSKINEERLLALIILTAQYKDGAIAQKEEIYQFYRTNMCHINNWNLVDSSAHLIIGAHLFERDRDILEELAASQNLWERRIAIVATWYFIRKSDLEWTFKIAKLLQNDSHDLIHKAVGWMLREAGKKDVVRLISFLCDHAHQMPKTMLRYATERLSKEQKGEIKA